MLPVFRRFAAGDYPTAPDWLPLIFNPLNTFAETTVATLNKNLTIGQNVQGLKYSTSFTSNSLGEISPIVFQYTGGGQPDCCVIGQITKTDGTTITTPIAITDWSLNINTSPFLVTVNYLSVLESSKRYNVTFLVI